MNGLRALLQPLPAASLVLAAAILTLAGAWGFQLSGFEPCELCLKQRYPWYAAAPLALAAIFLARNGAASAKALLGVLAVIFVASAVFGGYHAGVEWHFWQGPTDCTGDYVAPTSMDALRRQMQTMRIVRCDEVAIRIFGLSLADLNVLASAGVALIAGLGATAPKKT